MPVSKPMGIFGKSRKEQVVTTPPMTIVPIKKKTAKTAVRKPVTKRPTTKKTPARKQLSRNGYLCFYKTVDKKGGGKAKLYFWAKKAKSGEGWRKVFAVPEGKVVRVTSTGLPVLANKGSKPAKSAPKKKPAKKMSPTAAKKDLKKSLQPQCQAIAANGDQCKNSSRDGSKYCSSHKGYRPKGVNSTSVRKAIDTKPVRKGAKDTAPATRKSSPKKAKPTQVTRRGYLLYKSGPRYFFSKKKTAQKGWKRINTIPTGFKVKVTTSGLPVLARK